MTGSALLYFDGKYTLALFSEKVGPQWSLVYGTIGAVLGKLIKVFTIKSFIMVTFEEIVYIFAKNKATLDKVLNEPD